MPGNFLQKFTGVGTDTDIMIDVLHASLFALMFFSPCLLARMICVPEDRYSDFE